MPRQPRNGTFHPSATLFTNSIACKISFEHHQQWNQWWHFCELSYEAIHQTHVRTQRKTNHVANEMQLNFSESNRKEQLHSLSWTLQHCVAESHSPMTNSAHPSCYNRSMKRPLFHPVCKSIWRCIYRSICWYVCFILHLFIRALERCNNTTEATLGATSEVHAERVRQHAGVLAQPRSHSLGERRFLMI